MVNPPSGKFSLSRLQAARNREIKRLIKRPMGRMHAAVIRATLQIGLRLHVPRLVAFALRVSMRPLQRGRSDCTITERYISLHNSGLVSDLASTFRDAPETQILLMGQGHLKAIGRRFVGQDIDDFTAAAARKQSPAAFEALTNFLARTFAHLLRATRARLLISGNFTYWMMHPLGLALERCGSELVVVHKEGLVSAWDVVSTGYLRTVGPGVGRTTAARIAVQSEATRQLIAHSGVASLDRIEVIGAARLDSCHAARSARSQASNEGRARIVSFFTFPLSIGLWFPTDEDGRNSIPPRLRLGWRSVLELTLSAAEEVARRDPTLLVVVKSKSEPAKDPEVRPLLDRLDNVPLANISVVRTGEGQQYVLDSAAIVAFNSTIILEAIASGTPVLVPMFGEAADDAALPHLLPLGTSVTACHTPNELVEELLRLSAKGTKAPTALTTDQCEVLDRLAGNADGRSGERLRQFLARATDTRMTHRTTAACIRG